MDVIANESPAPMVYEAPRVLASFEAADVLAEAETGSVVIIIN